MAILGAVLGDIAGSQWEFVRPADFDWEHVALFSDKSFRTDDTVLTAATKYAMLEGVGFAEAYYEFGREYPGCTYGERFTGWLRSKDRQPYYSCGNGSAMRVSPISDACLTMESAAECARRSAECTHDHPEGIKGAVVTAVCGWMAKNGASKKEIENWTSREYGPGDYQYPVSMTLAEIRESYRWDMTCQCSVPVAVRCFLDSENYESFLRNVLSIDCDTDTLCAIGGGIAEEYYGGTGFNDRDLLGRYLDEKLMRIVFQDSTSM